MKKRILTAAMCGALALGTAGCGDETAPPPEGGIPVVPQATLDHTKEGWIAFAAGDYSDALAEFDAALAVSSNYTDALSGRGWARMRQDDFAGAEVDFAAAVAASSYWQRPDDTAGALVGRTFNAGANADYPLAALAGQQAQAAGGVFYVFAHDSSIDIDDVRLAVAEAFIQTGEYEAALQELVEIDVTVLNRVNPTSYSFLTQLLEELQRLSLAS